MNRLSLVLLLAPLLLPATVHAQLTGSGAAATQGADHPAATECCLELLLPVGANAVALGRALTTSAGPDAAFANPAGLSGLETGYFMIHRNALAGDATALSLLLAPVPMGTVGFSYQLVDFGDIETTNELGHTIGTLALRHHLLVASYATPIFGGLSAGLNYKYYQFRIGCSGDCGELTSATRAHALDMGLRYLPRGISRLRLGAVVSNAGFSPRRDQGQATDILPTRFRLGAAYEALSYLLPDHPVSVWLALELEDSWRDPGSPTPSLGLELNADDMVFLRAGYVLGDGTGTGASVGIGIHYTRFVVSVAKAFGTTFPDNDTEAIQVSFGIGF